MFYDIFVKNSICSNKYVLFKIGEPIDTIENAAQLSAVLPADLRLIA